jgi:hypothetical protein
MGKGRLEAFSDGVMAIIITIMVLEMTAMLNDGWNNPWKQSRSPSPSWWTPLADGSLPHNHHKPRLAGYELGGSQ